MIKTFKDFKDYLKSDLHKQRVLNSLTKFNLKMRRAFSLSYRDDTRKDWSL